MILYKCHTFFIVMPTPRTRGDDPSLADVPEDDDPYSPHTRG